MWRKVALGKILKMLRIHNAEISVEILNSLSTVFGSLEVAMLHPNHESIKILENHRKKLWFFTGKFIDQQILIQLTLVKINCKKFKRASRKNNFHCSTKFCNTEDAFQVKLETKAKL
jgi:hypothetical protein